MFLFSHLRRWDSRGSMNKSMSVATLSYLFICFFVPVANWINAVENHRFLVIKRTQLRVVLFDTYNHFVKNVSILFRGFSY